MAKEPRRIKPNPKDPSWTYPYASRQAVENAERYLRKLANPLNTAGWNLVPNKRVLPCHRKNKIPFESVRPDLRPQAAAWYEARLQRYRDEGREITDGIISSVRCNACRYGRSVLTHRYPHYMGMYHRAKRTWALYQKWLAEQDRADFVKSLPPTQSRQLEV